MGPSTTSHSKINNHIEIQAPGSNPPEPCGCKTLDGFSPTCPTYKCFIILINHITLVLYPHQFSIDGWKNMCKCEA